ncbi:hypothetical protein SERLA73DRAFT_142046 [Serpula lacrymans var. lacrymans S7.3]|uniref:Uncharacterized protein n=1 Tax=Serpula lacrymans var. lacrymans (strain S7.3) TaxID=936435 RepID=F8Q761_SERL3|nr:hypothetical protein SERLA73DRAFT_142046 [Serpula lacrymans var. lacrymans S7.3]
MAFIPLPPRPQNGSDEPENPSDDPIDALRKSQMSSGSHAGLLKHQGGLSVDAASLPPHPGLPNMTRPPSLSSSRSSLVAQRRPMQVEAPKSESSGHEPNTPSTGSVYSATSPRSSMVQNTPGLMMERNGSMASSLRYPAVMPAASFSASSSRLPLPRQVTDVAANSRPQSGQSSSTVGTSLSAFDEYTRMSGVTEGFVPRPSLPASPSPRYSPPYVSGPLRRHHNETRSLSPNSSGPRVSNGGARHLPSSSLSSVHRQATPASDSNSIRSMSASLHNRPESAVLSNGVDGSEYSLRYSQNSAVSPALTAVATPPSLANQPHSSFELRRSESARVGDVPITESPTDERGAQLDNYEEMEEIVVTPRPNREALARFRMDSTGSIVDMEEWRKLVFNAAGRAL